MKENNVIIQDIKSLINQEIPGIVKDIILFGSQINHQSDCSDYDILVILSNEYDWKLETTIIDLCYDIDLKYGIVTDIKIISQNELEKPRGKQSYIQEAIKNGIYA
jgi:predicted nucleotidyltransferase